MNLFNFFSDLFTIHRMLSLRFKGIEYLPQTMIFNPISMFATHGPEIFQSLNSEDQIILSFKYQLLTPLSYKDIGIGNLEFVQANFKY